MPCVGNDAFPDSGLTYPAVRVIAQTGEIGHRRVPTPGGDGGQQGTANVGYADRAIADREGWLSSQP